MYLRIISARFISHVLHLLAIAICFWSWVGYKGSNLKNLLLIFYRNAMPMHVKMMDHIFPIEISEIENILIIFTKFLYLDYMLHIQ